METLEIEEAKKIKGGFAITASTAAIIAGLIGYGIIFIAGLIEGITRPLVCRK